MSPDSFPSPQGAWWGRGLYQSSSAPPNNAEGLGSARLLPARPGTDPAMCLRLSRAHRAGWRLRQWCKGRDYSHGALASILSLAGHDFSAMVRAAPMPLTPGVYFSPSSTLGVFIPAFSMLSSHFGHRPRPTLAPVCLSGIAYHSSVNRSGSMEGGIPIPACLE